MTSERHNCITFDPGQCGGSPCIRGMRMRVTGTIFRNRSNTQPVRPISRFCSRREAEVLPGLRPGLWPTNHGVSFLHGAVPQEQVNEVLVGHAQFARQVLEVVDRRGVEADGDLAPEPVGVGILSGFGKIVFSSEAPIRSDGIGEHILMMRKVFHFDAPREKYQCDAAVIWCFDNRFQLGLTKYLKRTGVVNSDPIKIAGGAKSLASPEHETDRQFVLEQIRKSIRLHGTSLVILMVHSDCGAYGGLAGGFNGDACAEALHHEEELRRAVEFLRGAIPGIALQAYFVDFEGVWAVEVGAPQRS
jgi:Protein of unknown function (DUF433)